MQCYKTTLHFEDYYSLRMNYKEGLLEILLLWMSLMVHGVNAGHAPKRPGNTGLSCRPKQLTSLTKRQVEISLTKFDEANGQHLGTWAPGFPELTVDQNSPVVGAKVQCSLLCLTRDLEKILEDQRNNLNPEDGSLHKALNETISRVRLLAACLRDVLGGKCTPKPPPPAMPKQVFERKQWGHTLLKAATHYLDWLQQRLLLQKSKDGWTVNVKQKATRPKHQAFFEGSGYLL